MSDLHLGNLVWVEPLQNWLEKVFSICKIANSPDQNAKKSLLLEIFGLNLFLTNKKVAVNGEQFQISPQENTWFALRATKKKAALAGDKFLEKSELERFYAFARTHFGTKY